MNGRRWCVGVTVVVAAVGVGGIPAAAQQSPPAVELPAATVPAVDVPVPSGGPHIATPPISTPAVTTPAVQTPPIQTPVGTVPSVSVPAVKVPPVTVSPVKTVPAGKPPAADGGGTPQAGGDTGAAPNASDPPSTARSADPVARPSAPAVGVEGATARRRARRSPTPPRPDAAAASGSRRAEHAAPRHRTTPADPIVRRASSAPIKRVVHDRAAPAAVPVADAADRHQTAERPIVDALGSALRLTPILMALALAGALCAASRLRRT